MVEVVVNGIRATYDVRGEKGVLLCPPHPLMGGNRFDVRLERISSALHKSGFSTLRFDYRQPFRNGIGEVEDARYMLLYLRERHDFVAVVGYSFGAVVASNIADESDALVLISPLKRLHEIELKDSKVPKLIIYASYDDIVSVEESRDIAGALSDPKKVVELETDHFYTGKMDVLANEVSDFLSSL
ncbi:putative hydrolase of the alpha/beta superfamily [Geoglobus ahangari]|uniref:Putative hydrolase of the alpha/beta superfamily n=1 Tax=Geoglobus ahangari TaxID=113653 RepID=A0A0F7IGX2_9EURY|nr:dienelactone hydrolase family protein [Geoglobus ahangari]AKG91213.1 putative hydrolase of the alpha/beta superfamily [Geoglobus ahangari]